MAKIIPKRIFEDIRFKSDIVDVIGASLQLHKSGGSSFKALCPFHREKTPSFSINQQRQIFHCFGCGAGGDVFKFVMMHENVDFMTAAKMLAEKAGITLEFEEGAGGEQSDKATLFKILNEVSGLYQKALKERSSAAHARAYLEKRGLTGEIVDRFGIGYAPDRWDAVLKWGQDNKYTIDQLEKTGLILRKEKENGEKTDYYDRFRNRLMFPISDEQGRVIGFSGRTLDEADKTAKYVNTPETPLFHKSRVLYAIDKARKPMLESREAIVCEGQIDVIRCHQAGFVTAVASQGTAFTQDHLRLLHRYADSAVLVFDPDRAGQDAAIKTAPVFMQAGLAVRVAMLPKGKDPDLFIKENGAAGFKQLLESAESIVGFQVEVLSQRENAKTEVGVMRIARSVLQTIGQSPNAVQKAKLIQEAAAKLGLPASALQDDLKHQVRQQEMRSAYGAGQAEEAPAKAKPKRKEEVELCEHAAHMIDHPDVAELVGKYMPLDRLEEPLCRAFIKAVRDSLESGRELIDVVREADGPEGELQTFAAGIQMAPHKAAGKEFSRADAVKGLILYIWRRELEKERAELEKRQKERPSAEDEARCHQLTHDIKGLRKWDTGSMVIEVEMLA